MNRRDFLGGTGYGLMVVGAGTFLTNGERWMRRFVPKDGRTLLQGTVFLYGTMAMHEDKLLANRGNLGAWLDVEYRGLRTDFIRNVMDKIEGRQSWGEFPPADIAMLRNLGPDPRFYGAL